uniref:prolipoprotein diacylglyceryl transferase n=1 Tax=Thaumasiovibrio occultus TaxID=1891184 RepID=UPI000B355B8E|nr:prolipoprotein diacylglyceryl transferase [Thaumasiovibrio occultus]
MTQEYMIYPEIDPIFFSVGPLSVHWYGMMYLFAFLFANWLANRRADQPGSGWTRDQVSDLLFWGFLGVFVGGRLGYVLFYSFSQFLANPIYLFKIWEGGMSFHGGLLGVIAAMWLYGRKHDRTFFNVSDFVAPLVPMGLAFGRLGNFINGELVGRITDVPWAMIFPHVGPEPRHVSPLYQMAMEGLLLFFILNWFIRKPRPTGAVSGLFLLGYGVFRFIAEYFRTPDENLAYLVDSFGISMGQLLSLPMVVLGAAMMIWSYKSAARSQKSA